MVWILRSVLLAVLLFSPGCVTINHCPCQSPSRPAVVSREEPSDDDIDYDKYPGDEEDAALGWQGGTKPSGQKQEGGKYSASN